jgi:hypothetical protein
MAGHDLRYDQLWYYRQNATNWYRVIGELPPDKNPGPTERIRITDSGLVLILETLFQDEQTLRLPGHLREDLVLTSPAKKENIDKAEKTRPPKEVKR